jgi:hypothetical protein
MTERVVSVESDGRFKVSIRKDQMGAKPLYWYRLEEGFWWQDGGPYATQREAEQAAQAAKVKATGGIEIR